MHYFHCRQVEPSDDNLAANSLTVDVQNRNVKKVRIRAKVNFAIWVWETISMAVLFLVSSILLLVQHNNQIAGQTHLVFFDVKFKHHFKELC